ncbi:hypothetical protein DITRI_Ditri14bG0131800 [Diplodiscus trichospermus]
MSNHEVFPRVRKFFLRCYISTYSQTTISKWINSTTASASNLEELYLYVHRNSNVNLPSAFFSCQRLKKLRLAGGIIVDIPTDLVFPCLQTIKFISISIVADNPLDKLFSAACPKLEILHIENCSIKIFSWRHKTKLYLKFFKASWIQGGSWNNIFSLDSSSNNAKVLKQLELLDTDTFEIVKFRGRHGNRPVFEHLTHVVVKVGHKYCVALPVLLQHSPNLTCLVLERHKASEDFLEQISSVYWGFPFGYGEDIYKCLVCSLETVQIKEFNGIQEMEVVKYFLKNALVLKKLVLCVASALNDEIKASILDQPRASDQCEIEFRSNIS